MGLFLQALCLFVHRITPNILITLDLATTTITTVAALKLPSLPAVLL
jgi:hypothetical protein